MIELLLFWLYTVTANNPMITALVVTLLVFPVMLLLILCLTIMCGNLSLSDNSYMHRYFKTLLRGSDLSDRYSVEKPDWGKRKSLYYSTIPLISFIYKLDVCMMAYLFVWKRVSIPLTQIALMIVFPSLTLFITFFTLLVLIIFNAPKLFKKVGGNYRIKPKNSDTLDTHDENHLHSKSIHDSRYTNQSGIRIFIPEHIRLFNEK